MYEKYSEKRLYELHGRKGVSAREMSLSIGQNPGCINSIENNGGFPRMNSFFDLCEYPGVTPAEFFSGENEDPILIKEAVDLLRKLDTETIEHIIALLNREVPAGYSGTL